MTTSAVLLTGGSSRRMGFEKHAAAIDGRTILERTLEQLDRACVQVNVLGQSPVVGREVLIDETAGAGPAAALIAFSPKTDFVFVVACDIPFFTAEVIEELKEKIGGHDAAIPQLDGRPQYLCALYSKTAFKKWRVLVSPKDDQGGLSMRKLITKIDALETHLETDPFHITGVNTQAELEDLIRKFKS